MPWRWIDQPIQNGVRIYLTVALLYLNHVTSRSGANTPRGEHFGMNIRSLFVCRALLLFASVAYGAGSYQRTRDGQTLVWNDSPKRGEEATWSGKRDKNGFATGSGTLTWYKVEPTIVTGSNIPDTRRYAVVISRYSGKMVRGKFKGDVTYVDANEKHCKQSLSTEVSGRAPGKATRVRTRGMTATSTAEQTPTPPSQQTVMQTPERTPAPASRASSEAEPVANRRRTANRSAIGDSHPGGEGDGDPAAGATSQAT